jgi:glutamate--cysteine ligase catalytic subunit
LSYHEYVQDRHNNAPRFKVNPDHVEYLMGEGVDEKLAYHVAALFVRDPIVCYDNDFVEGEDLTSVTNFEGMNSSNWGSMRFKPPPSHDSNIGWRVEFRTPDIQITDFENSALTMLIVMIQNLINNFDVDFIMPITEIDQNMSKAYLRDAVLEQKFRVKTSILPHGKESAYQKNELQENNFHKSKTEEVKQVEETYDDLYLHEILAGKPETGYVGLLPLMYEFMKVKNFSMDQVNEIRMYLDFLLARAKGEIKTDAKFIRDFIASHPTYEKDSYVRDETMFDLLRTIDSMSRDDSNLSLFSTNKAEEEEDKDDE